MKTLSRISLLAAGIAITLPLMYAASSSAGTPDANTAQSAPVANQPAHHGLRQRRKAIARRIARQLNLNESQIAQIKTIRGSARSSIASIRANSSLTLEQKRDQIREILASSRGQMRAVLTPEQQTKLDDLKSRAWQRMGGF